MALFFITKGGGSETSLYWFYAALGFSIGFSIVNITMSAEQFGTNLRATAAISIPNMVRGSLTLTLLLFKGLRNFTGDYIQGAWITGSILIAIALVAMVGMKESFGTDLDYVEH